MNNLVSIGGSDKKKQKLMHVKSQIHYPLDTEAEQGRRIRVELSCDLSKREVEQEMSKIAGLIKKTLTNPDAVIEDVAITSVSECGKGVDTAVCKKLKTTEL